MGEVAREDGAIGFAQYGTKAVNGLKSHVNVTEADEAHGAVVAAMSYCCNDGLPDAIPIDEYATANAAQFAITGATLTGKALCCGRSERARKDLCGDSGTLTRATGRTGGDEG